MTALPYQPVPTATQQRELEQWVQRRYGARQYRDNQDEAIAEMHAARLRYELARLHNQPSEDVLRAAGESCCAVEEESPALFGMVGALRAEFGRAWPVYFGTYLILVALAVVLTLILTGVIHV